MMKFVTFLFVLAMFLVFGACARPRVATVEGGPLSAVTASGVEL